MSPLANHPSRPERVWRSQAAMNEPRPTRADLEELLKFAPTRDIWLEAKRQYLELRDA